MPTNFIARFIAPSIRTSLAGFLLCGAGLAAAESGIEPESEAASANVRVTKLAVLASYPQRSAPAQVVSLNEPVVSAEIAARVTAIAVRVGDVVEAGAELAKLDCANYALTRRVADGSLRALNARTTLAKQRVTRALELENKQLVSTDLLQERQTDLSALQADQASARATLQQAKLDQSRCVIVSPFKALVTQRLSAVGQYATIGTAVVKLVDLEQLEVSAQVFSQDADRLEEVRQFSLHYNDQRYPLKLRQILPVIDASTRNREVRLLFASEKALPGAAGKLLWQDVRPHLPAEVWLKRDGQLGIFILKEQRAEFVAVASAKMGRANAVNLPPAAQIITEGHYALNNGVRVVVAD